MQVLPRVYESDSSDSEVDAVVSAPELESPRPSRVRQRVTQCKQWLWRDEFSVWRRYTEAENQIILAAQKRRATSVEFLASNSQTYILTFARLVQRNKQYGTEKPVRLDTVSKVRELRSKQVRGASRSKQASRAGDKAVFRVVQSRRKGALVVRMRPRGKAGVLKSQAKARTENRTKARKVAKASEPLDIHEVPARIKNKLKAKARKDKLKSLKVGDRTWDKMDHDERKRNARNVRRRRRIQRQLASDSRKY